MDKFKVVLKLTLTHKIQGYFYRAAATNTYSPNEKEN